MTQDVIVILIVCLVFAFVGIGIMMNFVLRQDSNRRKKLPSYKRKGLSK